MEIRTEVINPLIAEAVAVFKGEPFARPYHVMCWLAQICWDRGIALNVLERNQALEQIMQQANNVIETRGISLTVGELRERLNGHPDNMPVFIQRIEDELFNRGWTFKNLPWETFEATPAQVEFYRQNPSDQVRIFEKDGKTFVQELSRYIQASSAYKVVDEHGKQGLVVNAHY